MKTFYPIAFFIIVCTHLASAQCSVTANVLSDVLCNGDCNGVAVANASGGTPPYTYTWIPSSSTSPTASGLCAGPYGCIISDAVGCTASSPLIVINQPQPLTASICAQTNVTCHGESSGCLIVCVSGGTPAYTYSWSPPGLPANDTLCGISAGTYTMFVTDANGCTATVSGTVTEAPPIIPAICSLTNVTCNGDSNGCATVCPSGGAIPYTYEWFTGDTGTTICNLHPGQYSVIVYDANGCSTDTFITITQPPVLTANAQVINNVSCNGGNDGAATVIVGGGTMPYTYWWHPPGGTSDTMRNASAGCYTIQVTDNHGCTASDTVCITQPSQLYVSIDPNWNIQCPPAPICVAAMVTGGTPNYTYTWLPTGGNSFGMCTTVAGTYTISVTDGNGCTGSATVEITQPLPLSVSLTVTDASCSSCCDGYIVVDSVFGGVGGYTYYWSPVSSTADSIGALCVGTYTVTVTDLNGCTVISIDTVSYPTSVAAISASGSGITIHPNPFTNELRITWNKGTGSRKALSLFDITGKEILRRETSEQEIILNTENLATGFYLLRVGGENFKVVKEE